MNLKDLFRTKNQILAARIQKLYSPNDSKEIANTCTILEGLARDPKKRDAYFDFILAAMDQKIETGEFGENVAAQAIQMRQRVL